MASTYTPVLNDVLEMSVYCIQNEQTSINRFHWQVSAVNGLGITAQVLVGLLDNNFNGTYKSLIANLATYRGMTLQRILPLPKTFAAFTTVNTGVGVGGAQLLGRQTAGLLSFQTQNTGRRERGRLYIPFPSFSAQTAGGDAPNNAYVVNMAVLLGQLVNGPYTYNVLGNGFDLMPVIFHRARTLPTPLPAGVSTINGGIARLKWATQRRRGDYGRANPSPI